MQKHSVYIQPKTAVQRDKRYNNQPRIVCDGYRGTGIKQNGGILYGCKNVEFMLKQIQQQMAKNIF